MKKIIITLGLMLAVTIMLTGCASQPKDSNQINNDTQTSNSENDLNIKKTGNPCYINCNAVYEERELIAYCKTGCDRMEIMDKQGCEKFCSKKNKDWDKYWDNQEACLENCESDVNIYKHVYK